MRNLFNFLIINLLIGLSIPIYALDLNNSNNWLFGISPEGFGFLGMIINFTIALIVSNFYSRPPNEIYQMIDDIRKP